MTRMIEPLHDYVLVKLEPEKTAGGILVHHIDSQHFQEAVVLGAGPGGFVGSHFVEAKVKTGDRVLVHKSEGFEVQPLGSEEKIMLLRGRDVVGIVKNE